MSILLTKGNLNLSYSSIMLLTALYVCVGISMKIPFIILGWPWYTIQKGIMINAMCAITSYTIRTTLDDLVSTISCYVISAMSILLISADLYQSHYWKYENQKIIIINTGFTPFNMSSLD